MKTEDVWLEDELFPAEAHREEVVKSIQTLGLNKTAEQIQVGIVRIGKPRGVLLDEKYKLPVSQKGSKFFLIRLAFEFDIHPSFDDKEANFSSARCETELWPANDGGPQPTAYAVLPDRLDEGGPTKVNVKINPSLKLEKVEASAGEVSFDLSVGMAQPVIVGWKGDGERAPYWRLIPKSKKLIGEQNFWIVAELPPGAGGVAVSARASAQVEVPRYNLPWPLRITKKSDAYQRQPRYVITV